jgi:hypothetical protein
MNTIAFFQSNHTDWTFKIQKIIIIIIYCNKKIKTQFSLKYNFKNYERKLNLQEGLGYQYFLAQ